MEEDHAWNNTDQDQDFGYDPSIPITGKRFPTFRPTQKEVDQQPPQKEVDQQPSQKEVVQKTSTWQDYIFKIKKENEIAATVAAAKPKYVLQKEKIDYTKLYKVEACGCDYTGKIRIFCNYHKDEIKQGKICFKHSERGCTTCKFKCSLRMCKGKTDKEDLFCPTCFNDFHCTAKKCLARSRYIGPEAVYNKRCHQKCWLDDPNNKGCRECGAETINLENPYCSKCFITSAFTVCQALKCGNIDLVSRTVKKGGNRICDLHVDVCVDCKKHIPIIADKYVNEQMVYTPPENVHCEECIDKKKAEKKVENTEKAKKKNVPRFYHQRVEIPTSNKFNNLSDQ
jgi:hypothetical protein